MSPWLQTSEDGVNVQSMLRPQLSLMLDWRLWRVVWRMLWHLWQQQPQDMITWLYYVYIENSYCCINRWLDWANHQIFDLPLIPCIGYVTKSQTWVIYSMYVYDISVVNPATFQLWLQYTQGNFLCHLCLCMQLQPVATAYFCLFDVCLQLAPCQFGIFLTKM